MEYTSRFRAKKPRTTDGGELPETFVPLIGGFNIRPTTPNDPTTGVAKVDKTRASIWFNTFKASDALHSSNPEQAVALEAEVYTQAFALAQGKRYAICHADGTQLTQKELEDLGIEMRMVAGAQPLELVSDAPVPIIPREYRDRRGQLRRSIYRDNETLMYGAGTHRGLLEIAVAEGTLDEEVLVRPTERSRARVAEPDFANQVDDIG
jgi:hypothetical protein